MPTRKVSISVNVSRENNGRVAIPQLEGITKMRINSIIFKNGPRKKSRSSKKKKRHDDSDSDDDRYENGNEDLMDALYLEVLVNDFIRGYTFYYDGGLVDKGGYTARIPIDLDDDGTGDFERNLDDYDWEVSQIEGDHPRKIRELDLEVRTDKMSSPKNYDMLVEFLFEVAA